MSSPAFDFKDLERPEDLAPTAKDKTQKFPCQHCGGTGKYQGVRIHQPESKCFSCGGKGYFKTSPEYRAKQRRQRKSRIENKRREYIERNKPLVDFLIEVHGWNDFAKTLIQKLDTYGELTSNQEEAAKRMRDKILAKRAEKAKLREQEDQNRTVLDLARINELFNNALSSGLQKPKLRLNNLTLSLAPANGKNAGYLYVKDSGDYAGKIAPDGKWYPLRSTRPEVADQLSELAANPLEAAVKHGRQLGNCACCGHQLVDPESVARGVGPICAERWGM